MARRGQPSARDKIPKEKKKRVAQLHTENSYERIYTREEDKSHKTL